MYPINLRAIKFGLCFWFLAIRRGIAYIQVFSAPTCTRGVCVGESLSQLHVEHKTRDTIILNERERKESDTKASIWQVQELVACPAIAV